MPKQSQSRTTTKLAIAYYGQGASQPSLYLGTLPPNVYGPRRINWVSSQELARQFDTIAELLEFVQQSGAEWKDLNPGHFKTVLGRIAIVRLNTTEYVTTTKDVKIDVENVLS